MVRRIGPAHWSGALVRRIGPAHWSNSAQPFLGWQLLWLAANCVIDFGNGPALLNSELLNSNLPAPIGRKAGFRELEMQ